MPASSAFQAARISDAAVLPRRVAPAASAALASSSVETSAAFSPTFSGRWVRIRRRSSTVGAQAKPLPRPPDTHPPGGSRQSRVRRSSSGIKRQRAIRGLEFVRGRFHRVLAQQGCRTTDYFAGFQMAGYLRTPELLALIRVAAGRRDGVNVPPARICRRRGRG